MMRDKKTIQRSYGIETDNSRGLPELSAIDDAPCALRTPDTTRGTSFDMRGQLRPIIITFTYIAKDRFRKESHDPFPSFVAKVRALLSFKKIPSHDIHHKVDLIFFFYNFSMCV